MPHADCFWLFQAPDGTPCIHRYLEDRVGKTCDSHRVAGSTTNRLLLAPPQAMSLMLPKNLPRRQLPDAATLESRMDCMRLTASYSAAALSNVQVWATHAAAGGVQEPV